MDFVDSREVLGSWLEGPKAAAEHMGADFGYRGERLGRPKEGSGSIAGPGRRIGALFVDGWIANLISYGLLAHGDVAKANLYGIAVFFAVNAVLLATAGTTFGKRLFGLRVIRLDGGRASIPQMLLRTFLLCLVVPAAIWDRDTRGLHDKAVATVEVRI
ncbi:RDD family protein [Kitasatospora viridis]|uniref:RDD family protein n=1 Tax=Kitasatospora viridis TaxID=281105 RepID=A0A561ULY2_9ACTN|nr:RDD family protein [Kitasatospora viridis]